MSRSAVNKANTSSRSGRHKRIHWLASQLKASACAPASKPRSMLPISTLDGDDAFQLHGACQRPAQCHVCPAVLCALTAFFESAIIMQAVSVQGFGNEGIPPCQMTSTTIAMPYQPKHSSWINSESMGIMGVLCWTLKSGSAASRSYLIVSSSGAARSWNRFAMEMIWTNTLVYRGSSWPHVGAQSASAKQKQAAQASPYAEPTEGPGSQSLLKDNVAGGHSYVFHSS